MSLGILPLPSRAWRLEAEGAPRYLFRAPERQVSDGMRIHSQIEQESAHKIWFCGRYGHDWDRPGRGELPIHADRRGVAGRVQRLPEFICLQT